LRVNINNAHDAHINSNRIIEIWTRLLQSLDRHRLGNAMQTRWVIRIGDRDQLTVIQCFEELFFLPRDRWPLVLSPEGFRIFTEAFFNELELFGLGSMEPLVGRVQNLRILFDKCKSSPNRRILLALPNLGVGGIAESSDNFLDMLCEGGE